MLPIKLFLFVSNFINFIDLLVSIFLLFYFYSFIHFNEKFKPVFIEKLYAKNI